jgi:quercetin dioxygenase-like cupin family protein
MDVFDLSAEQEFNSERHVEKILGRIAEGDVTVACWEPGQISPFHCHPEATEIYFCFRGGGKMRTPDRLVDVTPGSFVVHPAGELHEYINGPERTLLFRVRYGADMRARHMDWRGRPGWAQSSDDAEYFRQHPAGSKAQV